HFTVITSIPFKISLINFIPPLTTSGSDEEAPPLLPHLLTPTRGADIPNPFDDILALQRPGGEETELGQQSEPLEEMSAQSSPVSTRLPGALPSTPVGLSIVPENYINPIRDAGIGQEEEARLM